MPPVFGRKSVILDWFPHVPDGINFIFMCQLFRLEAEFKKLQETGTSGEYAVEAVGFTDIRNGEVVAAASCSV